MADQKWIVEAKAQIGVEEVKDKAKIIGWVKAIGPKWFADQFNPTMSSGAGPWCGCFAAHCINAAGLAFPENYFRAGDWESWGQKLAKPVAGCVVTFTREGGGHVGFVLGVTPNGSLVVLGGNQGNRCSVETMSTAKASAYRWPAGVAIPTEAAPVLAGNYSVNKTQA